MVPVIRDASSLSITQLASSIAELAEKVRSTTISVDELNGGTFTITNTGSRGALFDTPIINQPQSAILGKVQWSNASFRFDAKVDPWASKCDRWRIYRFPTIIGSWTAQMRQDS